MEIPAWLQFVLLLILGIPRVGAFPYQPPAAFTVSSTFRFTGVPVAEGLRHIHTLEHLESIPCNYFKIHTVSQPIRYGQFVTATTDCYIQGGHHTICVISRPDLNHTCTYMCLQGAIQRAQVQLQVHPIIAQKSLQMPGINHWTTQVRESRHKKQPGHYLTVQTTYFSGKRVLDRDIQPTMRFLSFFEDRIKHQGLPYKPHPNLQWYRRMVLGLSAGMEEEGGS